MPPQQSNLIPPAPEPVKTSHSWGRNIGLGLLAVVVISVGYFYIKNELYLLSAQDHTPLAVEHVEVLGPTPESERSIYKAQADYNNNISFDSTPSGDAVGYGTDRGWYYVESGRVYGPFIGGKQYPESDDQFWSRMEAMGWKVGMRHRWHMEQRDSKGGHTLDVVPAGPQKNCFDSQVASQSAVVYDGTQVGLHFILDGRCQAPVYGAVLSDDELHYAYLVRARRGYFVVADGKKSSVYPMITNVHLEGSAAVFNAVSNDFTQFVRLTISASQPAAAAASASGISATIDPASLVTTSAHPRVFGTAQGATTVFVTLADKWEGLWHSDPAVPVVGGTWEVIVSPDYALMPGQYSIVVSGPDNPHNTLPALTTGTLLINPSN